MILPDVFRFDNQYKLKYRSTKENEQGKRRDEDNTIADSIHHTQRRMNYNFYRGSLPYHRQCLPYDRVLVGRAMRKIKVKKPPELR